VADFGIAAPRASLREHVFEKPCCRSRFTPGQQATVTAASTGHTRNASNLDVVVVPVDELAIRQRQSVIEPPELMVRS
jgi:hypothetical protein